MAKAAGKEVGQELPSAPSLGPLQRGDFSTASPKTAFPPPSAPPKKGFARLRLHYENGALQRRHWVHGQAVELQEGWMYRYREEGTSVELDVEPGRYSVQLELEEDWPHGKPLFESTLALHYEDQDLPAQNVVLRAGQTVDLRFSAPQSGTIDGVVMRDGLPVSGEKVQLMAKRPLLVYSDEQGRFRFQNVPHGMQVVRCLSPWTFVRKNVLVDAAEVSVELDLPSSGFRFFVRNQQDGKGVSGANVKFWFHPSDSAETKPPQLLVTNSQGQTSKVMTGPGQIEYVVQGSGRLGLVGVQGSFAVESDGIREQEVFLEQGQEVVLYTGGITATRMTQALFLRADGVEFRCGPVQRLDDDDGYRVWGVPADAGRLYLSRLRSRKMWVAELPAGFGLREANLSLAKVVPVEVYSVRYASGAADTKVALLKVEQSDGQGFPIGTIYAKSFGIRRLGNGRLGLRSAELVVLPAGSYVLYFLDRNWKLQKVPVEVDADMRSLQLNLVFQ